MVYSNIIILILWFFSVSNLLYKSIQFLKILQLLDNKVHLNIQEEIQIRACSELSALIYNLEDAYKFLEFQYTDQFILDRALSKKEFLLNLIYIKMQNFKHNDKYTQCFSTLWDDFKTIVYKQKNQQISNLIPNWYFKFL